MRPKKQPATPAPAQNQTETPTVTTAEDTAKSDKKEDGEGADKPKEEIPAADRQVTVSDNQPPATSYESEFASQSDAEAALKETYKDAEKHSKAAGSYLERLAVRCADVGSFMSRTTGKIPELNELKHRVRELTTGEIKKVGAPSKDEKVAKATRASKAVLTIVDKTATHQTIGGATFENMLPLCCQAAILVLRGEETTFIKTKRSPTSGDVLTPDPTDGSYPSNAYDGIAYDQHILYPKVQTGMETMPDGTKVPVFTERSAVGQYKNKRLVGVTATVIQQQYKRFVQGADVDPNTGEVKGKHREVRPPDGSTGGGEGEGEMPLSELSHEDLLRRALVVAKDLTKGKTKALWEVAADLYRILSEKFEDEGHISEDDREEDESLRTKTG